MNKEFNNILNECLERLLIKGETIEQCLRRYPEQAAELEPLLQTALSAKMASKIQPGADFKARARYQFRLALREIATPRSRSFFSWFPRWATVATIVLIILLIGSGTVVAASNSMPDSPLYPVKLATEQAQLALTPSRLGKARLCAKLADRRVAEIVYMANKGDAQQIELLTQRLDKRLIMLAALAPVEEEEEDTATLMAPSPEEAGGRKDNAPAGNHAKLKMMIAEHAANHQAILEAVLGEAPKPVKPALRRAIEISTTDYENALEAWD